MFRKEMESRLMIMFIGLLPIFLYSVALQFHCVGDGFRVEFKSEVMSGKRRELHMDKFSDNAAQNLQSIFSVTAIYVVLLQLLDFR